MTTSAKLVTAEELLDMGERAQWLELTSGT
jgi:hypothetical protein